MRALALSLLLAPALAGCSQAAGEYPSLLPRPIESQGIAEPVRPVPDAAPDPALDSKIAEATAQIEAAESAFTQSAQRAEAAIAVARGTAEGSQPWINAQLALADLDTLRAPIESTLAALEELAIERGQKGLVPYPALSAAIARVAALSKAQTDRSAALEAALAS